MTIAPTQDFVLATVPSQEAGTASGILGLPAARDSIGIALIGTVLFGSLRHDPRASAVARAFRPQRAAGAAG
jgi:hypothetical protein